jgi:hypothetical protein
MANNPWDYWEEKNNNCGTRFHSFDMSLIQYDMIKDDKKVDFISEELCKSNEELIEYYKNYVMTQIDYKTDIIKYIVTLKTDGLLKMEDEIKMDKIRKKNEKKRLKKKLKKEMKKITLER